MPVDSADPAGAIRDALAIARKAARLQQQQEAISTRRLEIVAELVALGMQHDEIARLLDLSRQRVGQLVDESRRRGFIADAGD